jgi:hypothetical protein
MVVQAYHYVSKGKKLIRGNKQTSPKGILSASPENKAH